MNAGMMSSGVFRFTPDSATATPPLVSDQLKLIAGAVAVQAHDGTAEEPLSCRVFQRCVVIDGGPLSESAKFSNRAQSRKHLIATIGSRTLLRVTVTETTADATPRKLVICRLNAAEWPAAGVLVPRLITGCER